jgi:phage baseplate assembly protein W
MVTRAFATEDGILSTPSIITSGTRTSKDINLSFNKKTNGDVFKKEDAAAVKQAIKNLLMTNKFEKPFSHNFGADLSGLLFELNDDLIEDDVNEEIAMAIKNWEPRARLINVQSVIQPDLNNIFCRIEFQVISTGSIEVIETSVARLR